MNVSIFSVGIACVIAAIIGGGLKAFGIEIPVLQSVRRQIALLVFGVILIGANQLPKLESLKRTEQEWGLGRSQTEERTDLPISPVQPANKPVTGLSLDELVWKQSSENLMWPKNAREIVKTKDDAISYCNESALGGFTDWHVPDYIQFAGLAENQISNFGKTPKNIIHVGSQYVWMNSKGDMDVYNLEGKAGIGFNPDNPKPPIVVLCVRTL